MGELHDKEIRQRISDITYKIGPYQTFFYYVRLSWISGDPLLK